MKRKILSSLATLSILFAIAGNANADIIKITANSSSSGELGWFAVDEEILADDTSLTASQFYNYWWEDPNSDALITPADVIEDTGLTYFGWTGSEWTVTGGGGDSLTTDKTGLWIYYDHYVEFNNFNYYNDVSWMTTDYIDPVPEPATILLLVSGLAGFAGFRRKFKK